MECCQPCLYIGSGAHLGCAANQHPHLPGTHLLEQLLLFHICWRFMDKGYFLLGNTHFDELGTEIVIDIKAAIKMRGAQIAKHDLGTPLVCGFLPNVIDILGTGRCLTVLIVRQHGIHEPLIQRQLPTIAGNLKHIILGSIHHLIPHLICADRQLLDHSPLQLRWLQLLHMVIGLWNRQFQHLCGLNIRHQPEHIN